MQPDYFGLVFYILALIADCLLVFSNVYFLALFSDLETDAINPIDMCKQLNIFVYPEILGHGILTILFLFTGSWVLFLLNIPLVCWNIYR